MADLNLKAGNNITLTKNGNDLEVNADVPEIKNTESDSTTSAYSCDYENKCNTYSTSEVKTNKRWIDNKPIYRKTYTFTSLPSSNKPTIDVSSMNIDTFLPYEAFGTWSSGAGVINWPYYVSNTDNGRIYKDNNSGQVNIDYTLPDYNNRGLTVTLYYTKTTD